LRVRYHSELHEAVLDPTSDSLLIQELARRVRLNLPAGPKVFAMQTDVDALIEAIGEMEQAARSADDDALKRCRLSYLLAREPLDILASWQPEGRRATGSGNPHP